MEDKVLELLKALEEAKDKPIKKISQSFGDTHEDWGMNYEETPRELDEAKRKHGVNYEETN